MREITRFLATNNIADKRTYAPNNFRVQEFAECRTCVTDTEFVEKNREEGGAVSRLEFYIVHLKSNEWSDKFHSELAPGFKPSFDEIKQCQGFMRSEI